MGINIGLDIGAISLKLAALGKPADRPALVTLREAHPEFRLIALDDRPLLLSDYRRISGSPIQTTYDLLRELYDVIPEDQVEGMRVTGSGIRTIAKVLGLFFENEFKAIARMVGTFYPEVRTIFELGGESSKYIRLADGGIQDYDRSGELRRGDGKFSRPAGAAYAVFGGRGRWTGVHSGLRGPNRGAVQRIRQKRHDPRPAEGLFAGRDSARTV